MSLESLTCMKTCLLSGKATSLEDYYNNFKGMIDKSNQHHLLTNDIEVLKNSVKNYMQVSFRSQLSTQTTSRIATSRRREHFLSAKYILMC